MAVCLRSGAETGSRPAFFERLFSYPVDAERGHVLAGRVAPAVQVDEEPARPAAANRGPLRQDARRPPSEQHPALAGTAVFPEGHRRGPHLQVPRFQ